MQVDKIRSVQDASRQRKNTKQSPPPVRNLSTPRDAQASISRKRSAMVSSGSLSRMEPDWKRTRTEFDANSTLQRPPPPCIKRKGPFEEDDEDSDNDSAMSTVTARDMDHLSRLRHIQRVAMLDQQNRRQRHESLMLRNAALARKASAHSSALSQARSAADSTRRAVPQVVSSARDFSTNGRTVVIDLTASPEPSSDIHSMQAGPHSSSSTAVDPEDFPNDEAVTAELEIELYDKPRGNEVAKASTAFSRPPSSSISSIEYQERDFMSNITLGEERLMKTIDCPPSGASQENGAEVTICPPTVCRVEQQNETGGVEQERSAKASTNPGERHNVLANIDVETSPYARVVEKERTSKPHLPTSAELEEPPSSKVNIGGTSGTYGHPAISLKAPNGSTKQNGAIQPLPESSGTNARGKFQQVREERIRKKTARNEINRRSIGDESQIPDEPDISVEAEQTISAPGRGGPFSLNSLVARQRTLPMPSTKRGRPQPPPASTQNQPASSDSTGRPKSLLSMLAEERQRLELEKRPSLASVQNRPLPSKSADRPKSLLSRPEDNKRKSEKRVKLPKLRFNGRSLGEITCKDLKLVQWADEELPWSEINQKFEQAFGKKLTDKTHQSRYRQVQLVLDNIGIGDEVISRGGEGELDALKEINNAVVEKFGRPSSSEEDDLLLVQVLKKTDPSTLQPSPSRPRPPPPPPERTSPSPSSLPPSTPPSARPLRRNLSSSTPPIQSSFPGKGNTPEIGPQAHQDAARPTTGGKTIDARYMDWISSAWERIVIEHDEEKARENEEDIESDEPEDFCHWEYSIHRCVITQEQVDEENPSDDEDEHREKWFEAPWFQCGPGFDQLSKANAAAGREVYRQWPGSRAIFDRPDWMVQHSTDEFGMKSFLVEAPGVSQIHICVKRRRRAFHEQIKPTTKADWLPRTIFRVYQRLTTPAKIVQSEMNNEVYTCPDMANAKAVDFWVSEQMRRKCTLTRLDARDQWAADMREGLIRDLEESEELFSKEADGLEVWVEAGLIKGPRNM